MLTELPMNFPSMMSSASIVVGGGIWHLLEGRMLKHYQIKLYEVVPLGFAQLNLEG